MVSGRFERFEHDHLFEDVDGVTRMRDVLEFASPFGVVGRIVDGLVLGRYLRRLLEERNRAIKSEAEGTR